MPTEEVGPTDPSPAVKAVSAAHETEIFSMASAALAVSRAPTGGPVLLATSFVICVVWNKI